jgi:hypothetical protein
MNKQAEAEFRKLGLSMIAFLRENCHPHCTVLIDANHAELLEGVVVASTRNFIKTKLQVIDGGRE